MKNHCYRREFEVTAVRLANHAVIETQDVASALNIHPFMLSRWKKEVWERKLRSRAHPNLKEIQELEATLSDHKRIRELACPGRSGQGSGSQGLHPLLQPAPPTL